MKKEKFNLRFGVLALVVLTAAMSRLLPHPPNVTPVGAMAIFGGAYFTSRWQSVLMPLAALWLSDLVLNNVIYKAFFPTFTVFYEGAAWIYGAFALVAVLGIVFLKKIKTINVVAVSLVASVLFFLITNFGVWASGTMYPKTGVGLVACYTAGLPYLLNTLGGDLLWCSILFGGFEWAKKQFPSLAIA